MAQLNDRLPPCLGIPGVNLSLRNIVVGRYSLTSCTADDVNRKARAIRVLRRASVVSVHVSA